MKQNVISRTVEQKQDSKWVETYYTEDVAMVCSELCNRLIAKKMHHCKWITTIREVNLYNGFTKIYVNYGNGTRDIFVVPR